MLYRMALRLAGRAAWAEPASGADPLRGVAADLARRYPTVPQMPPDELAVRMEVGAVLLLDCRTPAEFSVSRLQGAALIGPATGAAALRLVIDRSSPAPPPLVVCYCAVGVRSCRVAARIGRPGVVNLEGGLFRWANEGRPMLDDAGPTRLVHPFNRHWARFLI
jgi:rhodanese-related sulfurtransferase